MGGNVNNGFPALRSRRGNEAVVRVSPFGLRTSSALSDIAWKSKAPPEGGTTNPDHPSADPFVVPPSGGGLPQAARDEAVRWMNVGCDLSLRNAGTEALAAYARAIELLGPLPLHAHPAWANSLGAALMNHGQLLHRVHGLARAGDALRSFDEAIGILAAVPADVVPWARRNLAGTHINRANLLLDLAANAFVVPPSGGALKKHACSDLILADARSALALVAATERTDSIAADLALKARRVHCDALGHLLVSASSAQQDVLATTAAELVDDALALIRFWSARGESGFAELAVRFFRFGTELYCRHQPHFLVEFIEENLAVAPSCADELRAIAHLAFDAALADGTAPRLLTLDDPVAERALRTREEVVAARARLSTHPSRRSGFTPRSETPERKACAAGSSGHKAPPAGTIASRFPA
jgi:hypothetical protein